ncbi:early endosome antigen 1 isoform X2 [Anabrus simplex]|uniref:early endosome antigen 1 isoform X2 n=1 Tax=Anabrus simplex TaxID=316456 RepID=UPI0035A28364
MDRKSRGKGFPGASNYKSVVETASDSIGLCKAITENGSECKRPQSLKIIDEIHQLYADRLQKIDDEAGSEGAQLKIKMLQSWVNDLGEQNAMLVRTVEKLEQEAAERVQLLEESLQRSSRVAMEYMKKLQDYRNQTDLQPTVRSLDPEDHDKQMKEVTGAKVDAEAKEIALSEKDEVIKTLQAEIQELQKQRDRVKAECDEKDRSIADMQAQIKKLQDDVDMKDSQIKGFIQRIQELRDSIAQKSDQAADLLELAASYDASMVTVSSDSAEVRRFELEAAMWKRKVADSEAELLQARTELRQVENDAFQLQSEIINVTHKLNESERLLQGALHERNELTKEVTSLSAQLNAKTDEIVALTRTVAENEKSAKDVREALTAEVAEKHDQLLALRRDVMHLEERCRQADMQTHFKDDIIKEMRKDVKLARSKLAILEEVIKDRGYSGDIGQRLLALNELAFSLPTKSVSYEHQNRFPSASFAYDTNFDSERIAQVFPYDRVSDSANFSHTRQFHTEKTHHAADLHSAVEKTYRHSTSLRHNLSHDKLPRTRTKSTRTQSQLSRVEEALKQELSKLNDQASSKPHQQHTPCHDVEVVESTTSTRTIGVQYSQQKQARIMVDAKDLEAKERRILELERTLKNVQNDMRKQFDEQKSVHPQKPPVSTGQFSVLKEQLEAMMNNLKDRDDKIARQNIMIEELESRLEGLREDLMQLHTRAEGYLKQMTATQKSHDESQRRISELKETLDSARLSMTGSLSKLRTSVVNKDVTKSMDNVLDYQHKAEECQATLTAMKGEIEYLMHNLASREKQIKNLEETVSNLKESLGTAKGEMEKAHHMAMTYLKEKEMVEAMQKHYEENLEDLKRALLACQEEKVLHHSEEKEMASILPDNKERIDELLKQDETTTELLIEAINELLDALQHATKAEEHAVETKKKTAVKFAEQSPEDYELQIKELQRQLKEAQARNSPEGGSKPTPPAAISLAREVEEYRIKTVEAQAALEELKDVIDSFHQNLQSRENQISDLEKMMTALLDTLLCAQKDISILQEKIEHHENMKKVNDFFSSPDGDVSQRKIKPSLDASCGEMYDPYSALTTFNDLVPDMEERWICMQKSLNKAYIEIRNIWAKAGDYIKLKEEFEVNRSYNEQKLEKLYLELESTQEDLKNTVIELNDSVSRD